VPFTWLAPNIGPSAVNANIQFNISEFVGALRAYKIASQKDGADVLNHAIRNVAYRAAEFTPVASVAKIRSSLMADPHLRYALTSIALKKRGVGMLKSPEFAKEVERFVSRRVSSARYLRAAYAEAIIRLGGTFKGSRFKGASGFANPATVGRLIAEIVAITSQPDAGHAQSAEDIGIKALQKAVDFVANDMLVYAKRKMEETAREHSG
jgi:hypothetical protein